MPVLWRLRHNTAISGIGGWNHEELVQYLKTGATYPKSQAAGGMAEAVTNSLQHLDRKDIEAIAKYVMTISPIRGRNETQASESRRPAHFESVFRDAVAGQGYTASGLALYSGYCASCHQPTGAGTSDHAYPALFQNTATGASRPNNLVSTILFGVNREAGERHAFMPRFDEQSYVQSLDDVQIAAISNYVLTTFGDPKVHVTDHDVATARKGGPASPLLKATAIFK